jgi:hypothetical protein
MKRHYRDYLENLRHYRENTFYVGNTLYIENTFYI